MPLPAPSIAPRNQLVKYWNRDTYQGCRILRPPPLLSSFYLFPSPPSPSVSEIKIPNPELEVSETSRRYLVIISELSRKHLVIVSELSRRCLGDKFLHLHVYQLVKKFVRSRPVQPSLTTDGPARRPTSSSCIPPPLPADPCLPGKTLQHPPSELDHQTSRLFG